MLPSAPPAGAAVANAPVPAYALWRFSLPGPVAGVAVKVNLADPRVSAEVVLADDRDPDGDGPNVGRLDVPSLVARKHNFDITLNASFFDAPKTQDILGKTVRYFVGNGTAPMGWHVSNSNIVSQPQGNKLRAAILFRDDGRAQIVEALQTVSTNTKFAVSGNALVLKAGVVVSSDTNGVRHPRSVVGVSADGNTLWLVAVDGRQESHSRGANMKELGELMRDMGVHDALNLDGGGSTALVLKDARTGVFNVANRPSEVSTTGEPVHMERPVADVIGIRVGRARN
jgi:peptidoglycan hydrolase-like protein with peptidoglycan-binding domain